jgi:hypothetical protein
MGLGSPVKNGNIRRGSELDFYGLREKLFKPGYECLPTRGVSGFTGLDAEISFGALLIKRISKTNLPYPSEAGVCFPHHL